MEITGRLQTIELNIVAQDYKVIMQILEKNMTEGQNEFKKPRKPRAATTPTEPNKGEKLCELFFWYFRENPIRVTNKTTRLSSCK